MSNNSCTAERHYTKKFSFKRKPFNAKQTGRVVTHEHGKEPPAKQKEPETVHNHPETVQHHHTPAETVQHHHTPAETVQHHRTLADDKNINNQNKQSELVSENENAEVREGFANKATQTRICCIHNHCKRKQRKRNGNFIQDTWGCLTKLCK